jgi:hypothetical protein
MISNLKLKVLMRLKYLWHLVLFTIYKFDSWHISSIESREYCIDVVRYINSKITATDCIIEIGCGLGETIQQINSKNSIGYDLSSEVISAAKFYHFFSKKHFQIGSFDSVNDKDIKYLIALNFLHDFERDKVSSWLHKIVDSNLVRYIILDEIADPTYQNNHDFQNILPKEFLLVDRIGQEYKYNRTVKVFLNQSA